MLLQSGLAAAALVQADPLPERLGELLSAAPDRREALVEALVESGVTTDELAAAFANGVEPRPDAERRAALVAGWSEWSAIDAEGVERPYQLYLPESLADGELPSALLVHLHGSVGRADYGEGLGSTSATGYGALLWPELADELGFALVCPQGRGDCAWWSDAGIYHVRATVRDVRRGLDVPDDAIFAAGFSDGASGCFALSMLAPDPFAGFIAMNGHPAVAATASDEQLYLENMAARPAIVGMTQRDSLYPSASVLPHVTAAIAAGARLHLINDPDGNHQPVYFEAQRATITAFLRGERRPNDTTSIAWWSANPRYASVGGLELLGLGASERDGAAPITANVDSTPGRIRLGIQLEPGGLRISSVTEASIAAEIGLEVGDVITAVDGDEVGSMAELRGALGALTYGGTVEVAVLRGDEARRHGGPIGAFRPEPIYRRDAGTAFARVRFEDADDTPRLIVESHGVRRLRLWLDDERASSDGIAAFVNGDFVPCAPRVATPLEVLTRFARSGDASAVRTRYVVLTH